jgi:hypothetical protein
LKAVKLLPQPRQDEKNAQWELAVRPRGFMKEVAVQSFVKIGSGFKEILSF